jgi:hypothetical protein
VSPCGKSLAIPQEDPVVRSPPRRSGVILSDGLTIEAADDPALVPDDAAPASLILSARDLAELTDILGPGSSVLVRQ